MDRSECRTIVERHAKALAEALGIGHWRLVINYGEVDKAGPNGWKPLGECHAKPHYERASITLDPAAIDDEAELLEVLRHELMHVVTSPYRLYRNFAASFVKRGSSADVQEDAVWEHADEEAVRNLERFWMGAEEYWRRRIAEEQRAGRKVGGRAGRPGKVARPKPKAKRTG